MQATVYIPKDLEKSIKEISDKEGKSIQQVLLSPWRVGAPVLTDVSEIEIRLRGIEKKLDLLIPKGMPESLAEGRSNDTVYGPDRMLNPKDAFKPDPDFSDEDLEWVKNNEKKKPENSVEFVKTDLTESQLQEANNRLKERQEKEAAKKKRPKATVTEEVKTPKGEVKTNKAMAGFFKPQLKDKDKKGAK